MRKLNEDLIRDMDEMFLLKTNNNESKDAALLYDFMLQKSLEAPREKRVQDEKAKKILE